MLHKIKMKFACLAFVCMGLPFVYGSGIKLVWGYPAVTIAEFSMMRLSQKAILAGDPVIAINVNYAWYGIKRDIFWNIRSPVIQWLLLGSGMAMVICGVRWMFVGTPAERQKKRKPRG